MCEMEGWEKVTLIDLAQYINGFAFKPADWNTEGMPIIRIEQLKNPKSINDYCNFPIPEYNIINNGDLIFSWSASLFLKIWQDGKAALNQHLFKVLPFETTDKLFLKYLIEAHLVEINKTAQGTTMQHITRKNLEQYSLYVPKELNEQRKIAEILSTIDKAIEQTEALIAKYKNIKKGLMHDLLSYGIDKDGNIRNPETHGFVEKNGMVVPEEWKVLELKDLTTKIGDGIHTTPIYEDNTNYFFINGNNLKDGKIIIDNKTNNVGKKEFENHRIELNQNTILMSINGTIGNIAFYHDEPVILGKSVCYVNCKADFNSKFLFYFLSSHYIETYLINELTGSTIKNLSLASMRKMPICISDSNEQSQIVRIIENQDNTIKLEETNLAKLQKQKQGLMQDLLTGKVRVKTDIVIKD